MQFFSSKKVKYGLAKYLSVFFTTLLFFCVVSAANAYYDVVIAWDPNNDPDLAGYILYVDNGSTPMPYGYVGTYQLDDLDPVNPSVKIIDLKDDLAYYFAVTAYDIDGNESGYSAEICVINGGACPSSWLAVRSNRLSNASVSGGSGGGGGICFISTSNFAQNNIGVLSSKHIFLSFIYLTVIGIFSLLSKKKIKI